MKRIADYDEFGQSIPKNKKMVALSRPGRQYLPGYVTKEEFETMQKDLTKKLNEMTKLQEDTIEELKRIQFQAAQIAGTEFIEEDIDD